MELKELIYNDLKNLSALHDVENLYELLTYSPDAKNGDVTLPCFSLAKVLRVSPIQIADSIITEFKSSIVEKIVNVNGYVNFYLDKKKVFEVLYEDVKNAKKLDVGSGKTVCIDFSSVNLAKYMHIGHLSTTVIGSVIANTYEYLGYKVVRLNYVGDYGTPFGKMITAIKHWGDVKDIVVKGVDYIQDLYVKFNVECENDPALMDEAREWSLKIEKQESEAYSIYKDIISVSISEAKRICDMLGIEFDSWRGESYYNDKMQPVIDELNEKGLLVTSEGARIVDLEKHNLGVCMIQRSDGGSLYSTRDLAAAMDRYNEYKFDLCIYVTSVQQKLHFERWFKVTELLGKPYANSLKHVIYGTYSLPSGKIGSRFGKQALVADMINVSVDKAKEIISTRGTKVDNMEKLASSIGIGAVKFGVLKTERIKDCVFDLDSSLNFDGETSPYIQYTHARCNSILKKSEGKDIVNNLEDVNNLDAFELIKHVNNFDKMIISSANDFEPCYISRYLITLCGLFNKFYNSYRIIDNDIVSGERLKLVDLTKDKINKGLTLLGIDSPEAM